MAEKKEAGALGKQPADNRDSDGLIIPQLRYPHVNHAWHVLMHLALRLCGPSWALSTALLRVHVRVLPWIAASRGPR